MSCHCGSLWIMEVDLGCVNHGGFLSGSGRSGSLSGDDLPSQGLCLWTMQQTTVFCGHGRSDSRSGNGPSSQGLCLWTVQQTIIIILLYF